MKNEKQYVKFKLETNINTYEISGWVVYDVDKNYGADADGNRGTSRTFIDDYDIINIVNIKRPDVELKKRISQDVMIDIYDWFQEKI